MSERHSYRVGIDENGLGPRLGPLLVTAVLARVAAGGEAAIEPASSDAGSLLGDSKQLVAHGDVALAEAWAHLLVARGAGRDTAAAAATTALTPDHLLHAISLDDGATLRAPCPSHVKPQCWSADHDGLLTSPRCSKLGPAVEAELAALADRGVEILAVRSVIVCSRRLNDALAQGRSRLRVDLHAMERLILAMRALTDADLRAVCGKVGGYRDYGKVFGPLGERLYTVLEETRARSAYQFAGVGEVSFVRDADGSDRLVGLASLVGKYLRELTMGRIVQHYRQHDPELPDASGYNDPVTTRFIAATESRRREQQVPDTCFERASSKSKRR